MLSSNSKNNSTAEITNALGGAAPSEMKSSEPSTNVNMQDIIDTLRSQLLNNQLILDAYPHIKGDDYKEKIYDGMHTSAPNLVG